MKKNILALLLAIAVTLSMVPVIVLASDAVTATPTASKIFVDGISKSFDAYDINGNNYFKLRDIAFVLNGTSKQFEVSWDRGKNAIKMLSNMPYTTTSEEMAATDRNEVKTAIINTAKIYLDGKEIEPAAYLIDGNNYFKLRDLSKALNFGVEWDGAAGAVLIKTTTDYVEENTAMIEHADVNKDGTQIKSFGRYTVPAGWSEAPEHSHGEKYFYVKDGVSFDVPPSNISVEAGKNKYSGEEILSFRDAIYNQLIMQTSRTPTVSGVFGEGTYTKKGHVLIIFTIEEESLNTTTKQYYIVGDYQYILIQETNYHNESVSDVSEAARAIVDSFEWAK